MFIFGYRFKASILAGLIVLSTILSLFISPQAYAAGTLLDVGRGWSVLKAVIDYSTNLKQDPNKNDVDSCKIFRDTQTIGHHLSTEDGKWDVSTPPADTISSGLNAVGIAGCSDLMTVLGYTLEGDVYHAPAGRAANTGLDRNDVVAKLKAKGVETSLIGSDINSDSPSDTIAYIILYQVLTKTCGWQFRNAYVEGGGATDDEKTRNAEAKENSYYGDTQGEHSHTYSYEQAKTGDNTYYVDGGREDDIYLGPGTSGINMNSNTELDCADSNDDTVGGRLATRHQYADAYGAYRGANLDVSSGFDVDNANSDVASEDTTSTCGVKGGLGWIICPATSFLADAVDTMYTFIADQLEIPITMFNTDPGTYTAWKVFRDYANVAFIIAFLMIVYSQVTSVGISNYGIKKMLPKLIVAAILVNISYFLCQLAVDVTNLLGRGITNLFDGIAQQINTATLVEINAVGTDGNGKFATMIAGILIGGVILVVALALGLILPILLAVAMVFLILLLRKVLIVVLIAISPLAFVAYLLPNTEKWFKKWYEAFLKVLMVFPIVAIVVGGSKVASRIISAQATNNAGGIAGSSSADVTSLIAAGVLTIPFFVVPGLLKKSLDAAGSVGAKFQRMGDKATGRVGKKAKEGYQKTSYAQGKKLREAGKEQYKRRKFAERVSGGGGPRGWATRKFARGGAGLSPSALRTGGTQAGLSSLSQSAQAQADEGFEKDVRAAGLEYATQSSGDIMSNLVDSSGNISSSMSGAQRAAAIDRVMASGSFDERRKLVEATQSMSEGEKARVSKGVYAKGDQNVYGSGIGSKIQSKDGVKGANDLRSTTMKNIEEGHVNAEHLVQGESSAKYMVDVARGERTEKDASGALVRTSVGPSSTAALAQLRGASDQAKINTGTKAKASGGAMADELNRIP